MKKSSIIGFLLFLIFSCEKDKQQYYRFGEEIFFDNHIEIPVEWENDDVILSGTLYLPINSGVFPAVVMVHGSGPMKRIDYIYEHYIFLRYTSAKVWTDRGYALFSYDKRGVGESGGQFSDENSYDNLMQLGRDAISAIRIIKRHNKINSNNVGFFGSSQAGYTIPIVAESSDEISFNIIVNGPTNTNGEEFFFSQMTLDEPFELQYTRNCCCINLDSIYNILEINREQGYNYWGYSSYQTLTKMNQPSLFILGLKDLSVPTRLCLVDLNEIIKSYNKNWEIITFEDGDHYLMPKNGRCVDMAIGEELSYPDHVQVDWETPTFNWLDEIIE